MHPSTRSRVSLRSRRPVADVTFPYKLATHGSACALALGLSLPTPSLAGEEIPFITTPDNVTLAMLRLARVGPRDHVIDLGSGDGRIVITAARRFGASGLGVEIVPELVQRSRENARSAGVQQRVEFREQDLFKTDLSKATVVTLYLLPEVNLQLRPALLALKPGTRVVSHDWDMGDWKPDRTITVAAPDKTIGREKLSRLHLWVVPARVEGRWCAVERSRGIDLQLRQSHQEWRATVVRHGSSHEVGGVIVGAAMRSTRGDAGELHMTLAGQQLQVTRARGALAALARVRLVRSDASGCPAD
jgi:SAM-dependent methyltransferase